MTEVDPYDDSIKRYAIKRHAFDPETKHFRWFFESAYDKKREYEKKLQEAFEELDVRQKEGAAHRKEQIAGQILDVGYFANSKSRRAEKVEEGRFCTITPRNRLIFLLLSRKSPLGRSRKLEKFLRRFLSK